MTNRERLDILSDGIIQAGRRCKESWGNQEVGVPKESHHSVVTKTDLISEGSLIDWFGKHFPLPVLSEESFENFVPPEDNSYLIIDPLDGTSAHANGLPDWSVSGVYVEKGSILLATTYAPVQDEVFTAVLGDGVYSNGKKVTVSQKDKLQVATINLGQRVIREDDEGWTRRLIKDSRTLWVPVSTALCLANLASGRLDVALQKSQSIWDIAAGQLLVTEAGGEFINWRGERMLDFSGARTNNIFASNAILHNVVLPRLPQK